jgi:hypothetical protein
MKIAGARIGFRINRKVNQNGLASKKLLLGIEGLKPGDASMVFGSQQNAGADQEPSRAIGINPELSIRRFKLISNQLDLLVAVYPM